MKETTQIENERKQMRAELLKEIATEIEEGGAAQRKKAPQQAYAPALRSVPYNGNGGAPQAVGSGTTPPATAPRQDNRQAAPLQHAGRNSQEQHYGLGGAQGIGLCYTCGDYGHLRANCPRRRGQHQNMIEEQVEHEQGHEQPGTMIM